MTKRNVASLASLLVLILLPCAATGAATQPDPDDHALAVAAERDSGTDATPITALTAHTALDLPTLDPTLRFVTQGSCDWDGCCESESEGEDYTCGDCNVPACSYDGICDFDESDDCSDCIPACGTGPGSGGGGTGCPGAPGCPCVPIPDGPSCD